MKQGEKPVSLFVLSRLIQFRNGGIYVDTDGLRVVLFTSRNKDNKRLPNFKERTRTFISDKPVEDLSGTFESFANKGVEGELSRLYISINPRDPAKIKKALMHYLIDAEDVDLCKLDTKLSSIAQRSENSLTRKWMFDYDDSEENLAEFLDDIKTMAIDNRIDMVYKTPNGYAVVVDHGFDTRELLGKWHNVELKRDALLCYSWKLKQ